VAKHVFWTVITKSSLCVFEIGLIHHPIIFFGKDASIMKNDAGANAGRTAENLTSQQFGK